MVTKMAKIFTGGLVLTADVETAIRFALRTGTVCSSDDGQLHTRRGGPVSPLARIFQGILEAERLETELAIQGLRGALGDRDEGPATVRETRAA